MSMQIEFIRKKQILNWHLAVIICLSVLYAGFVQLIYTTYCIKYMDSLKSRDENVIFLIMNSLALIAVLMPFMSGVLILLRQYGSRQLYTCCQQQLKKHWPKIGICLAILYFLLKEYTIIDLYMDSILILALFIPFLIGYVTLLKRYGSGQLCICCLRAFEKHWVKLAIYLLLLYLFIKGFTIGNFYIEHRLGTAIWLKHNASSAFIMAYCFNILESFPSLLFYSLAPGLCYVSWALKYDRMAAHADGQNLST